MSELLEATMLLCFIAGEFIVLVRLAREKTKNLTLDRFFAISTGIGFGIHAACGIFMNEFSWLYVFSLVGFFVAYTSVLFSFPGKDGT